MSDVLTELENQSIRKFVHSAADEGYLRGRVLDYGCGRSPYRRIIEEHGGEYVGFDLTEFPANMSGKDIVPVKEFGSRLDAILCTQVLQYVPLYPDLDGLESFLIEFRQTLEVQHGHLVLTYPTNWPEVQDVDLHRFTRAGMERLLIEAGFSILRHERRATFHQHGYEWAFGYGCVARA